MPSFHEFMMRHGEHGVQDLIERMERYRGIHTDIYASLEQRWALLMRSTQEEAALAA